MDIIIILIGISILSFMVLKIDNSSSSGGEFTINTDNLNLVLEALRLSSDHNSFATLLLGTAKQVNISYKDDALHVDFPIKHNDQYAYRLQARDAYAQAGFEVIEKQINDIRCLHTMCYLPEEELIERLDTFIAYLNDGIYPRQLRVFYDGSNIERYVQKYLDKVAA